MIDAKQERRNNVDKYYICLGQWNIYIVVNTDNINCKTRWNKFFLYFCISSSILSTGTRTDSKSAYIA